MLSMHGSGKHWAVKYVVACLLFVGGCLIFLNTDTGPIKSPFETLKEASGGLSVQDFAGTDEGDEYWPSLRVYTPYGPIGSTRKPIFIFMHGGGWVRGTLEQYDPTTRGLAVLLRDFIVVSVEYRLSPGIKFPGAISDCKQALRWVIERADQFGGDLTRIVIGGDSAGANLAIALTMLSVEDLKQSESQNEEESAQYINLCANVFIYPVTDYSMSSKSYKTFADTSLAKKMGGFWHSYLQYPNVQSRNPLASPILAKTDQLSGFPPSLLLQAEVDPLRDEGLAFGKKLEESGVQVLTKIYPNVNHGFLSQSAQNGDFTHAIWTDITAFLQEQCMD